MKQLKHLAIVLAVAASSASASGQTHPIADYWVAQHPVVVERLVRLWLADPDDPEVGVGLVRLLEFELYLLSDETYLLSSDADVELYLHRVKPGVAEAPQLFLLYLEARGVRLAPAYLLLDRTFRVVHGGR